MIVLTAFCFVGCSGSDGGGSPRDERGQDAAADAQREGGASVVDGSVLPNGAVLQPNGEVVQPDGAVLLPDGALLPADAMVPHGHDAGPFCRASDAGLAPIPARCVTSDCLSAQCMNGVKDTRETDVDCGGSCKPCAPQQRCSEADDCANKACSARFCEDRDLQCDSTVCLATPPASAVEIKLPVNAIVRNPQDGVVFAAIGAQQGGAPGAVIAFAPGETTPSYTISLPGQGGAIAITDDAKKLYVAVGGSTPGVARVDLASRSVEPPFALGKNNSGQTLYAAYLAPVPGHPELIGVVHAVVGTSVGNEGLYLYRDGARVHPNQKSWQTNSDQRVFGVTAAVFTSDTRAYTLNGESTSFDFATVDISSAELRVSSVRHDIIDDFRVRPVWNDGRMFIGDRTLDLATMRVLGDVRARGAVAVDDGARHTYYTVFDDDERRIGVDCFDAQTYARSGSLVLDVALPAGVSSSFSDPQLVLWGSDGLAIKVDNMGSTRLLLLPHALRDVPGCEPAVTPSAPALLTAPDGHDDFTQTYCLHVRDAKYAPAADTIYAAVSERDPRYANRLVALGVGARAMAFATPVGSDPGSLAVSDDESTAWVGLSKAGYVVSTDLKNPTAVQPYPTPPVPQYAPEHVLDVALLPGSRDVLAVAGPALGRAHFNIYDRGVPRYTDVPVVAVDSTLAQAVAFADASRLYVRGGLTLTAFDLSAGERKEAWTRPTKLGPLQLASGKLFDGTMLVDLAGPQLLGGISEPTYAPTAVMAPDARHAYRAQFADASPPGKTRVQVQCFDLQTFAQSGSLTIDLPDPRQCAGGAIRLGMLGDSGLTFASEGAFAIAPDVLSCVPGCSSDVAAPPYVPPSTPDVKGAPGKVSAYTQLDMADIEHDPKSGALFVSLGDLDPRAPNHVLALDANGALQYALPVGSNPGPLALSADGSKLYVGLTGAARIVTVDLASHTVSPFQRFEPMPNGTDGFAYAAPTDIEVVPGAPDRLAVGLVQRADMRWLNPVLVQPDSVEPLVDSPIALPVTSLFPVDPSTTWLAGSLLTKLTRQSDGTFDSEFDTNVSGNVKQLVRIDSDRFATNTGAIVDAHTGGVLGKLTQQGGVVASDDGKKLYVVSGNSYTLTLTCYDATTATQTGSATLSLPETVSLEPNGVELELLGARGLAMRSLDWPGISQLLLFPGVLDTVPGC